MQDEQVDSQLFTIRVWSETDANNQRQWRGKLRHVPSGEIRHFREWAALIPLILDMLNRYAMPNVHDDNPTNPAQ